MRVRNWSWAGLGGGALALALAVAGCAGGQTGDTGTDEAHCQDDGSYEITIEEARERGLPVDAWIEGQLGKEQLLERELPQLMAPVELWLDYGLVPPPSRMTSASVRVAPTGMVTVLRSRPISDELDPAECGEHGGAELRAEWQLPEMADTLTATFVADSEVWSTDRSLRLPYFGGGLPPKTQAGREPFSTYDTDFPAHHHGYFGTDHCSALQPLPVESTSGKSVGALLAASGLGEQLAMTLDCADMRDPEFPIPLPSRELTVSLALPEEYCPPTFLPGEIAAVGSAAIDDQRFETMNAWVRVADAYCLGDSSARDECRMVTVAMAPARENARSEGAAQAGGIMNGFVIREVGPRELRLQLQLRDGQRTLFVQYDDGYTLEDTHVSCAGKLDVSP